MADNGRNRRSNIVTLTVLGLFASVVIADKVIPQPSEMRRNVYANRADCERDYSANQCQQSTGSGSSGGSGGGYHGPYYRANRASAPADDPGSGRAGATRVSYETSYRGGFGSFGRAIHAVG